jgi:hypothetical protein
MSVEWLLSAWLSVTQAAHAARRLGARKPEAVTGGYIVCAVSAGCRFRLDDWLNSGRGGARMASGLDRADGLQGLPDVRRAGQR